jgi:hypothetical protein
MAKTELIYEIRNSTTNKVTATANYEDVAIARTRDIIERTGEKYHVQAIVLVDGKVWASSDVPIVPAVA